MEADESANTGASQISAFVSSEPGQNLLAAPVGFKCCSTSEHGPHLVSMKSGTGDNALGVFIKLQFCSRLPPEALAQRGGQGNLAFGTDCARHVEAKINRKAEMYRVPRIIA
jgi:hypothetical protein